MARRPATKYQNQQISQSLVPDAKRQTLVNGPAYFCMVLYRSDATENRPSIRKKWKNFNEFFFFIDRQNLWKVKMKNGKL